MTHTEIKIISYESKYQSVFHDLNEAWIQKYFKMEESDYKALDNPKGYILDRGGVILVALVNEEALGVCALIPMSHHEFDFELVKMAVSPKAQGKGLGYLLGKAILDKGKELGAKKIFLESNTILAPAIHLYKKLGFQEITGQPTPYERCNIQMEFVIS